MPLILLVLLAFGGCALSDDAPEDGAGDAATDGPMPADDAAANDSGSDAGVLDPMFDGLRAAPDPEPDSGEGLFAGGVGGARNNATCYDSLDQDGDGAIDCQVSTCQLLNACCIGSARCCASPSMRHRLTCADSAASCIAGSTAFGTPEPFVDESTLALGGDELYDSGLLGNEMLDLTSESTTLEVTFEHARCESAFCLESAAVGLTRQDEMSATEHVEPIVALHSARGWVQVRVGEVVVDRFEIAADVETYTLTLRTDGSATVVREGEAQRTFAYAPVADARLVMYGHSRNPSATLEPGESRARIANLEVAQSLCENPNAWAARSMPTLPDLGDIRRVTSARSTETWIMVMTEDGREAVFRETAEGLELLHPIDVDPLKPGDDERIVDAGLVDENGATRLYVLVESGETLSLVSADWNVETTSWDLGNAEGAVLPADFRAPSLVHLYGHLVIVGETDSGLELQVRKPDDTWTLVESDLRAATAGARHPSLIVYGGAYELHYAHRVGARWRIGLAASDELIAWRSVERDALTGGDDFDRVGARAPAAVGEDESIRLYYVGMDGVSQRLGMTHRRAATAGTFQ